MELHFVKKESNGLDIDFAVKINVLWANNLEEKGFRFQMIYMKYDNVVKQIEIVGRVKEMIFICDSPMKVNKIKAISAMLKPNFLIEKLGKCKVELGNIKTVSDYLEKEIKDYLKVFDPSQDNIDFGVYKFILQQAMENDYECDEITEEVMSDFICGATDAEIDYYNAMSKKEKESLLNEVKEVMLWYHRGRKQ